MKFYLFIFLFFTKILIGNDVFIFSPPNNWKITDPSKLLTTVKAGFVGKSKSFIFKPSINLAIDDIDISFEDYILEAKKLHLEDKNNSYLEIDKIKIDDQNIHISQITTKTHIGNIYKIQAILVKNNKVYILTGATLKQDFTKINKEILNSIKTTHFVKNLEDDILDKTLKEKFITDYQNLKTIYQDKEKFNKKEFSKSLKLFQNFIANNLKHLGKYWQFLALEKSNNDFN